MHRGTPETPGPGARPRPRRQLPRHRLSGGGGQARRDTIDYLRAREQVTLVYREAWRTVWLDDDPQQQRAGALLHGRPRPPAICRPADARRSNCISCGRATAAPATTATTCWRRSRRSSAQGYRDARAAPAGRAAQGRARARREPGVSAWRSRAFRDQPRGRRLRSRSAGA